MLKNGIHQLFKPFQNSTMSLYGFWGVWRNSRVPRSSHSGDRTVNLALDTLELLIEATYTRKTFTVASESQRATGETPLLDSVMPRLQVALRKTVFLIYL